MASKYMYIEGPNGKCICLDCMPIRNAEAASTTEYFSDNTGKQDSVPPVDLSQYVRSAADGDPLFSMGNGTWLSRSTIQRMIDDTGYLNIDIDEGIASEEDEFDDTRPESDVDATLAERGENYGDFSDNAEYSQDLKFRMQTTVSWDASPAYVKEALELIASKIARMLSGTPMYADSWRDIQGYAKLVEDRINEGEE
jgi:hypothetical protein